MTARLLKITGWILAKLLYAAWVALMIAVPLFGFWVASSLAAFENASQWLALVIGLALFPLVPVGWELIYVWRRARRGDVTKPILTRLDRLVLRTLLVNGLFLGVLLWRAPHVAFQALAVRGDWILDGHDGPIASGARGVLLGFADRFAGRWHGDDASTYGTSDHAPPPPASDDADPTQPIPGVVLPVQPRDRNGWPVAEEPDPLVAAIPDADEASVEAVGHYFAAQITDPHRLAKALHDYVIARLSYDEPTAALAGPDLARRPSQQAADVFAAKTGVCEGYARLYAALGKAAGLDVAYVVGNVRDDGRTTKAKLATDEAIRTAMMEGDGHAWNAVKLDGTWTLVDTTWDDPVSHDKAEHYQTTYLFTPPRLFAYDHFPDEAAWQLLATPLGVGEFTRQPEVNPYIGALGAVLEDPKRSQVTTTTGEVAVTIANPFHATIHLEVAGNESACAQDSKDEDVVLRVHCRVPVGEHEIELFGMPGQHTAAMMRGFGKILVNSR